MDELSQFVLSSSWNDTYVDGDYDYSYFYDKPVEDTVTQGIMTFVPPVILILATIGNPLIIAVMIKWRKSQLWSATYFAILAAVDILQLYTKAGNDWVAYVWDINVSVRIRNTTDIMCQLLPLGLRLLRHLSIWLVVALIIDRTIMLRMPHKVHKIFSSERVFNSFLILLLVTFLVNAHVFWTHGLMQPYDVRGAPKICSFLQHGFINDHFRQYIWPVLNDAFGTVVPCLVIIVFLIYGAQTPTLTRDEADETLDISGLSSNRWVEDAVLYEDFMRLVKLTAILSIVLSIPETAYNMFEFTAERLDISYLGDNVMEYFAKKELAQSVTSLLWDIFTGGKFLLFIIASRYFRQASFSALLYCTKRVGLGCKDHDKQHEKSAAATLSNDRAAKSEYEADFYRNYDVVDNVSCLEHTHEMPSESQV